MLENNNNCCQQMAKLEIKDGGWERIWHSFHVQMIAVQRGHG
jgi:hypothetical protein